MIAVKLMGGLGNQMFQYAAGRSLALARKTSLVLDLSHYEDQPPAETPRHYELGCFNIKAKLTTTPVDGVQHKRFLMKKVSLHVIQESSLRFDPVVLDAPNYTLLKGQWASEKYFMDFESQIRKDFKFISPLSAQKEKVLKAIRKSKHPVSLHVRRGDLISNKTARDFTHLMGPAYYTKAVKEIAMRVSDPEFFVFSDDSEWCKKNLKLGYPTTFVDYIPDTGDQDMRLMSNCSHHITGNSTFSWWAAWLNNKPEKIVVTPRVWFKAESADIADLLPAEWIKI